MKKLIIIIAAIVPMLVFGQQTSQPKNNALTLTAGGVGNNLSINYERTVGRTKDGLAFSLGAGYRAQKYSEYTSFSDQSNILLGLLIIPFNPSLGTDILLTPDKSPKILSITKDYNVKSPMVTGAVRYKMIEFGLTSRTDFVEQTTITLSSLANGNVDTKTNFEKNSKSYILPSIAFRYEKKNFLMKAGLAKAAPETSKSKCEFLPFLTVGVAF
jgi:hypothetical protein